MFARSLFARILHRFCRPWSFRDCHLPSLISSQVQQFLTPTQFLNSLLTFIYSQAPLCQNSSSLLRWNSKIYTSSQSSNFSPEFTSSQSLLCDFSSLRRNSSHLHLQLFLILDLFARTYLFAIFDLFTWIALRNSLLFATLNLFAVFDLFARTALYRRHRVTWKLRKTSSQEFFIAFADRDIFAIVL